MDTAMRDLERIEERSSDEGRGVLVLSGVGLVAALAVVVAAVAALPGSEEPQGEDPLQMLAIAEQVEVREEAPVEDPEIDPETLSFPNTLVTDSRPEVAVALAAAAAELEHLDPVTKSPPRSDIAAGLPAVLIPEIFQLMIKCQVVHRQSPLSVSFASLIFDLRR